MNRFFTGAVFMAMAGLVPANALTFTKDNVHYETLDDQTVTVTGRWGTDEIVIPATVTENGITYSVVSIKESAFLGTSITKISAAESVVSVGKNAFFNTSKLTDVNMPGVTTLGERAFFMSGGGKIVLSDKLTNLPKDVFANSAAKLEFDVSGIRVIGDGAFRKCSMDNVVISDGATLEQSAFQNSKIGTMTISGAITLPTGSFCFDNATVDHLTVIDMVITGGNKDAINPSVTTLEILQKDKTSMDIGSISCTTKAQSVYIDADTEHLTSVSGSFAFGHSFGLRKLEFGPKAKVVYSSMFYGCNKLETVILSSATTKVEADAFANCDAIKTVECLADEPPTCSPTAFTTKAYSSAVLKVKADSNEAYAGAEGWKLFTNRDSSLSGLENIDAEYGIKVVGDRIIFECPASTTVSVFTVDGRLVYSGMARELNLGHGFFIVRIGRRVVRLSL